MRAVAKFPKALGQKTLDEEAWFSSLVFCRQNPGQWTGRADAGARFDDARCCDHQSRPDPAEGRATGWLAYCQVGENSRLVGIVTDRDMAVRGLAGSKGPNAKVRDVMTPDVKYCFADQVIDEITANMADIQVRRLPVLDRDKRLVGILSLGDIATSDDIGQAAEALSGISRPLPHRRS